MTDMGARLLVEREIDGEAVTGRKAGRRSTRSVTVNLTESPLGWLLSRRLVTRRQFDAGERLRSDWERAQLSPNVTMNWNSAPIARSRGGAAPAVDLASAQFDARRRFDAAIDHAGAGLSDILWRVVCAAKACAMRRARWAGRPVPGS